ncbi:uncharacterized protein BJX67DRAFT_12883 [Aspergillus lucknowensis]|uniref:Uncharacterized protein n=1 Tax=Aspergillus lucknowensis TaxID=176173 RepID=A0ABR4M7L6_9EURO
MSIEELRHSYTPIALDRMRVQSAQDFLSYWWINGKGKGQATDSFHNHEEFFAQWSSVLAGEVFWDVPSNSKAKSYGMYDWGGTHSGPTEIQAPGGTSDTLTGPRWLALPSNSYPEQYLSVWLQWTRVRDSRSLPCFDGIPVELQSGIPILKGMASAVTPEAVSR